MNSTKILCIFSIIFAIQMVVLVFNLDFGAFSLTGAAMALLYPVLKTKRVFALCILLCFIWIVWCFNIMLGFYYLYGALFMICYFFVLVMTRFFTVLVMKRLLKKYLIS